MGIARLDRKRVSVLCRVMLMVVACYRNNGSVEM